MTKNLLITGAGVDCTNGIGFPLAATLPPEIQRYSTPVIEHCYREFLLHNHDPEEREYVDDADQIREVLIHGNYLSQRDIEICLAFDPDTLAAEHGHAHMRQLHQALRICAPLPGPGPRPKWSNRLLDNCLGVTTWCC